MDMLALILSIIGSINWGLVGIFKFDLVAWEEPIRFVTRRVKHLAMLADALRVEPSVQPALVAACSL